MNEWPLSSNRSSATSEKKQPTQPKRKEPVWPRKHWSGKRGKPRDGTDPETPCRASIATATIRRRRCSQRGDKLFDVQKLLTKTGWNFIGPAISTWGPGPIWKNDRGDPGINRLDRIAKAHDIDYGKAKDLKDKWAADRKMIAKIDQLPGRKTQREGIVKNIMEAKLKLGM